MTLKRAWTLMVLCAQIIMLVSIITFSLMGRVRATYLCVLFLIAVGVLDIGVAIRALPGRRDASQHGQPVLADAAV